MLIMRITSDLTYLVHILFAVMSNTTEYCKALMSEKWLNQLLKLFGFAGYEGVEWHIVTWYSASLAENKKDMHR
jgi:hypothetical protein